MKVASSVLDFSSADATGGGDGGSGSGSGSAFRVDADPEEPDGTKFHLKIYAHDYQSWQVTHSGASGGNILNFTHEPGVLKNETVEMGGGNSINTDYPVRSVTKILANSGLYDLSNGSTLVASGGKLSGGFYSVVDGQIIFSNPGEYYGALTIEYTTTPYKKQWLSGLSKGTHYVQSAANGRSDVKTFVVGNANANDGDPGDTTATQSITIRDYVTDLPIPGAAVYILGQTLTADENGVVIVQGVDVGQTIAIRTTKSGYHDSDADTIDNDTILT